MVSQRLNPRAPNSHSVPDKQDGSTAQALPLDELAITVVHDNYPHCDTLRSAWGFAAYITGPKKTILFDTGSDGTLLLENMARLQIEPGSVETLVLSHVHPDHTGGLTGFLKENSHVRAFLPESFPARFKDTVRGYGATVVEVNEPCAICPNVYSTGILGRLVKEQALMIRTDRGLVVLTGCAHPGITGILRTVTRLHEGYILLVMGGFHLEWATVRKVEKIITAFRSHGVQYVAPTHCSGDKARALFQRHYGPHYLDVGVGKKVLLAELT